MDATRVPGARADRCLIFDSDDVVRRAWNFPDEWAELDDDSIWALLDRQPPPPRSMTARAWRRKPYHAATRSDHLGVVQSVAEAAGRRNPVAVCSAVTGYTASLRARGVSPERAIVLIKNAVREGLDQAIPSADHVERDLLERAVSWCIDAYYRT